MTDLLEKQCPRCGKKYVPHLAYSTDFKDSYALYLRGASLKEVYPKSTPIQQAQIITGICSEECWGAWYDRV